jgi:hypothetical protein
MVKRKVGNQTGSLTPDHGKSGIDPIPLVCDTSLESSQRGLQLWFRPHPNRRSAPEVIVPQSCGTPNLDNFDTPILGVPRQKAIWMSVYYMEEGGGFPRIQAVMSLVSPELPVACPSTKGALEGELTNLLVGLMQVRVSN